MKVLWWLLFVGFGSLNVYAAVVGGLDGIGDYLRALGPWGVVATVDLLTALFVGVVWMWRDARAKGVAALPYALLTLGTGSLGLLLYLIRHDRAAREARVM
jgi:hypothetical protein